MTENIHSYVSNFDNDIVEALWVEINLPQTKPILVGTVYRAPDSKVECLAKIDSLFQDFFVMYMMMS